MSLLSRHIDKLYSEPNLRRLFWEATTRCNLSCLHCGSDCSSTGSIESGDILTADEMCLFLNRLAKDFDPRSVYLCISGGEPLLREDLFEVMAHASGLGFYWGMTTSGILLTEDVVQNMARTNCKTVSVSLDGLNESHNTLRGRDCFGRAIDGIRLLLASGCFKEVQVTTVVHKRNIHELPQIYNLMETLGVDSWRLTSLEPIGRAHQMDGYFLDADDFTAMFDFIREHRKKHSKIPVTFGCSHYLTTKYEMDVRDHFFMCGSGLYTAGILSNGDIYGCLNIERKYGLVQGNIRKDNFADVWQNGFKQFRRRRDKLNAQCKVCADADFCRGDSAHSWDFINNAPICCLPAMTG